MRSEPAELVYLLRSLSETGDVLHIGAHPDDEDGGLMALLAHHYGTRVVYWSATRGESGQNRVSSYQGEELGVYRTWESIAARQIDGGESLFGPFYDYGFSKNGAEAGEKWGEAALVREIVRAIRIVQPQIVIVRWRGDASDGHGHHTAVGAAAKEAFHAAGDGERFPELERLGLVPWQPRKLYQAMMGDWQPGEDVELGVRRADLEGDGYLRLNTGGFDPLAGVTYQEQGALAFNEYLTQAVGSVPTPGDFYCYLRLHHSETGAAAAGSSDLFEGVDRGLTALADYPGGGSEELRRELEVLKDAATSVADQFRLHEPWQMAPELLDIARRFRELPGRLETFGLGAPARRALERYLERKLGDAEAAASRCLGLRLEASLDRAHLTPGESARLECRLWSYGPDPPDRVELEPRIQLGGAEARRLDDGSDPQAATYEVTIPGDAGLSCPYWLRAPRGAYEYAWPELAYAGEPFDPPLVELRCSVEIGDHTLVMTRPVLHPQAFVGGYRELTPSILPPISVQPRTSRHVLRAGGTPHSLELHVGVLGHHASSPLDGVVEIEAPEGWTVEPGRIAVQLQSAGDANSFPLRVTVPPNVPPAAYEIRYFVRSLGRLYDAAMTAVRQTAPGIGGEPDAATCIREQFIARPAHVTVDVIDAAVFEEHSHGYVAGPGDPVPGLLASLGLSVHTLSDEELAHGALDRYDTIVIGPNAYLVRDALRKNARRILQYVEAGGTLVVQYQGYPHEHMGAAPFPFRYNQPHDRVTLENRPVELLRPDHFLLHFPNTIGADDFAGWVRDRGMYFFGEWDNHYEPLLGCADPGEEEKRGGLLVASHGKGTYVYCGYTLFRQLSAGVPGAFRLFANLLAVPEARIRQRMDYLRTTPLFSSLDEAGLHAVGKIVTERRLADGQYLCREGDDGDELYIVTAGTLEVWKGEPERRVSTCEPGVPVGELAALTDLTRSASLKSRGETQLFVVGSGDFRELLRREPEISDRMVQLLARRLAEALAADSAGRGDLTPSDAVYR